MRLKKIKIEQEPSFSHHTPVPVRHKGATVITASLCHHQSFLHLLATHWVPFHLTFMNHPFWPTPCLLYPHHTSVTLLHLPTPQQSYLGIKSENSRDSNHHFLRPVLTSSFISASTCLAVSHLQNLEQLTLQTYSHESYALYRFGRHCKWKHAIGVFSITSRLKWKPLWIISRWTPKNVHR